MAKSTGYKSFRELSSFNLHRGSNDKADVPMTTGAYSPASTRSLPASTTVMAYLSQALQPPHSRYHLQSGVYA
jgi:hypothetical protein